MCDVLEVMESPSVEGRRITHHFLVHCNVECMTTQRQVLGGFQGVGHDFHLVPMSKEGRIETVHYQISPYTGLILPKVNFSYIYIISGNTVVHNFT